MLSHQIFFKVLGAAALALTVAACGSNNNDDDHGSNGTGAAQGAFFATVLALVATSPDDTEPREIESISATSSEDAEPFALGS